MGSCRKTHRVAYAAPTAVLIRPDGYVAWVGQGTDHGPTDALTLWFGPVLPVPLTSRHPR
jgi:hypothetical protein